MAEERIIDDDKDRKYRIKLNEDGEEELVVDTAAEESAEAEEAPVYVVEEPEEDDEEAAVMTPEQLAAKREREERERAERQAQIDELLQKAKSESLLFRYATALEYLEKVEELDPENGELHALKISAYTRDFKDYSQIIPAAALSDDVKKYVSEERKSELFEIAAPSLEENIAALRAKVTDLNKQNEDKKAERAVRFIKDRNIALIIFACIFAALAAFAGLTAYFATIIYTVSDGTYLILTCVFAGLTFIALLATALAARRVNVTCRRVRMNKRNTSTQLGRDLLTEQEKLRSFIAVYSALKGEK